MRQLRHIANRARKIAHEGRFRHRPRTTARRGRFVNQAGISPLDDAALPWNGLEGQEEGGRILSQAPRMRPICGNLFTESRSCASIRTPTLARLRFAPPAMRSPVRRRDPSRSHSGSTELTYSENCCRIFGASLHRQPLLFGEGIGNIACPAKATTRFRPCFELGVVPGMGAGPFLPIFGSAIFPISPF